MSEMLTDRSSATGSIASLHARYFTDYLAPWLQLPAGEPLARRRLQLGFASISRRYFCGTPVLFPREAEFLELLTTTTEELVAVFNEKIAAPIAAALATHEPACTVDIKRVKESRGPQVQVLLTSLIDFARGETLDDAGERTAAHQIMERHLTG